MFSRVMPFCRALFEASMEIVRPFHLLGVVTEPALPKVLDDLEILELDSCALCCIALVPRDIEGFERGAFVTARS